MENYARYNEVALRTQNFTTRHIHITFIPHPVTKPENLYKNISHTCSQCSSSASDSLSCSIQLKRCNHHLYIANHIRYLNKVIELL